MQMFVSSTIKRRRKIAVKCAFKPKFDVKYEFWPLDIIPNVNRPEPGASVFVR